MLQATIKPTWDAFGFQSDLEDSQPVKQTASQRQETQQKKNQQAATMETIPE